MDEIAIHTNSLPEEIRSNDPIVRVSSLSQLKCPDPSHWDIWTRRWLIFWLLLGTAFTSVSGLLDRNRPFTADTHGWAEAHTGLMAENFSEFGVFRLRGIPIENMPIAGRPSRDFYTRWPPLHPIVVGLAFRHWGVSEGTERSVGLAFWFLEILAFYWLTAEISDSQTALAAAFVLQMIPVSIVYSEVWTVSLGFALGLGALAACFRMNRTRAGLCWAFVAFLLTIFSVLTSWECVLFSPGLAFGAVVARRSDLRSRGLSLTVAALFTALGLIFYFSWSVPEAYQSIQNALHHYSRGDLPGSAASTVYNDWGTYVAIQPVHGVSRLLGALCHFPALHRFAAISLTAALIIGLRMIPSMIGGGGLIGVAACVLLCIKIPKLRYTPFFALLVALLSVFFAWLLVFPQHLVFHAYEYQILAPAVALSVGYLCAQAPAWVRAEVPGLRSAVSVASAILLPAILMILSLHRLDGILQQRRVQGTSLLQDSSVVAAMSTPQTIVVTSEPSRELIYYSGRHVVGGIQGDSDLEKILPLLRPTFDDTPILLAIPMSEKSAFSNASQRFPLVGRRAGWNFYRLQ